LTFGAPRYFATACARERIDRSGCIIGFGGGVSGDLAGFVAACWMRGVRFIQVPTTLLAMVDAAIGGKSAVNVVLRDGSLAKNAVGAFAMPELVVCDPSALNTLPPREMQCGLAECVKHALLADAGLADWLAAHAMAVVGKDSAAIAELVARAAAVKVAIVDRDPTERGDRALLNLGHTYAHAIEARHDDCVKHGEAVAIGLVAAMTVACRLGRIGKCRDAGVVPQASSRPLTCAAIARLAVSPGDSIPYRFTSPRTP
jgi:3-dehydroquinate synthase